MKIEIVVDPSKPLPLASRVAPAPAAAAAATGKAQAPRSVEVPQSTGANISPPSHRTGAGRGRRGRGGARKTERPPKTAADLDAEMEVRKMSSSLFFLPNTDSVR
jgi:THO complex subunit 4